MIQACEIQFQTTLNGALIYNAQGYELMHSLGYHAHVMDIYSSHDINMIYISLLQLTIEPQFVDLKM